ncbi:TPA: hypothetical protein ACG3JU_003746 [Clostridioides difficile]|nr:hypothetical protein [Clostridioides difficile]
MKVEFPLRLTGSGLQGYQEQKKVDIIYEDGIKIVDVSVINSDIMKKPFIMEQSSGFDSKGNRITNIVGFDGTELLKVCPNCGEIKPATEFDYKGRVTNSKRDQSNCGKCRANY